MAAGRREVAMERSEVVKVEEGGVGPLMQAFFE